MESKTVPPALNTTLYDRDIREPLFDYLEERFGKTRMFEEKQIARSRADILMLTESLIAGLEIKSDADTYVRLKRQIRDYDKFCDLNYVVIGKSHEKQIEKHVPPYWGILVVELQQGEILFYEKRPSLPNPKVKEEQQCSLLWRTELQHLLEQNHLPAYRQKSKKFVRQKLMEKLEWQVLKRQICEELFQRDYTIWEKEETAC